MKKSIQIGDYLIGNEEPAFIIAEIGVNHNGDVNLAIQMIEEAARQGANCVKFQTFKAERVVMMDAPKADYQLRNTSVDESQLDMLTKLELSPDAYNTILKCCKDNDIEFLSTPYNVEDVDFLERINVPAYKLASIHCAEPWFARYTASKGRPVILSTGMASLGEIDQALNAISEVDNDQIILLQCTTNYPSLIHDANLNCLATMSNVFDSLTGYSDHTEDEISSVAAIALGARVIEKHFTTDKSLPGPDQSTSASPVEFGNLVKSIRKVEQSLGSYRKYPSEQELENSKNMRRSLVARVDIEIGTVIEADMLESKRPSNGIAPRYMDFIIGKTAQTKISKNTQLSWEHIKDNPGI